MRRFVTIAAIQSRVSNDTAATLKKTGEMVRQAAQKGAQIICLQELYRTIYFPQYKRMDVGNWAETVPGESTRTFAKLAQELGVEFKALSIAWNPSLGAFLKRMVTGLLKKHSGSEKA